MLGRSLSVTLEPAGIVGWFLIAAVVATLASIFPAQRAAQISIREALAYE